MPTPRVAILGIHLESNAFAPVTTEEDFRKSCWFEGPAMLAEAAQPAPAMPAEIPGFIEAMNGELVLAARFADGVEVPIKLAETEDAA